MRANSRNAYCVPAACGYCQLIISTNNLPRRGNMKFGMTIKPIAVKKV